MSVRRQSPKYAALPAHTRTLLRLLEDGKTVRVTGSGGTADYRPESNTWSAPEVKRFGTGLRSLVNFVRGRR